MLNEQTIATKIDNGKEVIDLELKFTKRIDKVVLFAKCIKGDKSKKYSIDLGLKECLDISSLLFYMPIQIEEEKLGLSKK